MSLVEELRTKKSRDNRELLDRAADEIERLQDSLRLAVAIATVPKGDGGIKQYGGYVEVTDVLDLPSALKRRNDMNTKELAKKLCEESGCHHKCHDTTDCVVEDEAREYLPFVLTNEDKVSVKYFTPSEVSKMTPKEVRENYDLIIQSMERWNMSKEKQSEHFSCGHENGGNWVQLPCVECI